MPRHQISDFVSIPLPHVPVGGRLKHFLPQWKALTSDPFILNMVTGMDIPLENRQPQVSIPPELVFSEAEKQAADEQIQTLLNKRAIVECFHIGPDDFVSNVFLRPKKGGSYHMILNLKKFNDFMQYEHFKMETLDHICELMTEGCFMCVVDFSNAYLTMPINRDHVQFLKFRYKGKIYMYLVLPFGLACAPRYFTKLCKVPLIVLRWDGHIVVMYIDDGWISAQTYDLCLDSLRAFLYMFVGLGFLPHPTKCSLTPSQEVVSLGFVLNSVTMRISMQPEKVSQIIAFAREVLARTCTIREVA